MIEFRSIYIIVSNLSNRSFWGGQMMYKIRSCDFHTVYIG